MKHLPYNTLRLSRIATNVVIFAILFNIAFDLLGLWQNQKLRFIMSANTPYAEAIASADRVDLIMLISGISLIIVSIFSFTISAIWIFRASKNAAIMDPYPGRIRPGWAVGWYFIPFANLWKPFVAVKEIWNSSFSPAKSPITPATALVGFWWACHIANNIYVGGLTRKQLQTDNIELFMTLNNAMLASSVMGAIVGILFIKIMRKISERQMSWTGNPE